MGPRRTALPRVSTRYDFATRGGRRLSVVVHQDGRRSLGLHSADAPYACQKSVSLEPDEGTELARLVTPSPLNAVPIEGPAWSPDASRSTPARHAGRPQADTRARTRTGASTVTVLRRTSAHPRPGPDFRLAIGDPLFGRFAGRVGLPPCLLYLLAGLAFGPPPTRSPRSTPTPAPGTL